MKTLSEEKTRRLWDRLQNEAQSYYETLHMATTDLRTIGPCDESDRLFSDLQRWRGRLKSRFIVMWMIGRYHTDLSDKIMFCADQVIGYGELKAVLQKRRGR